MAFKKTTELSKPELDKFETLLTNVVTGLVKGEPFNVSQLVNLLKYKDYIYRSRKDPNYLFFKNLINQVIDKELKDDIEKKYPGDQAKQEDAKTSYYLAILDELVEIRRKYLDPLQNEINGGVGNWIVKKAKKAKFFNKALGPYYFSPASESYYEASYERSEWGVLRVLRNLFLWSFRAVPVAMKTLTSLIYFIASKATDDDKILSKIKTGLNVFNKLFTPLNVMGYAIHNSIAYAESISLLADSHAYPPLGRALASGMQKHVANFMEVRKLKAQEKENKKLINRKLEQDKVPVTQSFVDKLYKARVSDKKQAALDDILVNADTGTKAFHSEFRERLNLMLPKSNAQGQNK